MTSCSAADYQKRAIESLANLPPFSPTLNRLLAMLASEDTPYSKLGEQIEKDTVLAGNILKTVNSALYGRIGTVTSIVHAISIMGTSRLRNCALAFSVNRLWSSVKTPARWSATRFNSHSLAAAMMADRLAEHLLVPYAEGAFAAGLFHDLGKLLIALTSIREYDALHKEFLAAGDQVEECERRLLGVTHSELSALALERWNLPKPVQDAVGDHHHPGEPRSLANLVWLADSTVHHLGYSLHALAPEFEPATRFPQLENLKITDQAAFLESFKADLESLRVAA